MLSAHDLMRVLYWLFGLSNAGLFVTSWLVARQITRQRGAPGVRNPPLYVERGIKLTWGVSLATTIATGAAPWLAQWLTISELVVLALMCAVAAAGVPYFFLIGSYQLFTSTPHDRQRDGDDQGRQLPYTPPTPRDLLTDLRRPSPVSQARPLHRTS